MDVASLYAKTTASLHFRVLGLAPYKAMVRRSRAKAKANLRLPCAEHSYLVDEMRENGVAQRHLDGFGVPYAAMLAAADRMCAELARDSAPELPHHYGVHRDVSGARLLADPEPYLFAVSEPLLDLVEAYLGLPVRYFNVSVKREIANGQLGGARHWHRDPEAENVFKIIVYLNDVDARGGPLEVLSAPVSAGIKLQGPLSAKMGWALGYVPEEKRISCIGKRLTANVCDTGRCLHRVAVPTGEDRYSITFSYGTDHQYLIWDAQVCQQLEFVARYGALLSTRQRAASSGEKTPAFKRFRLYEERL
jgi:hypothetical protein